MSVSTFHKCLVLIAWAGLLVTVVFLHDIGIVGDRREKGSTIEDIRVEEEEKSKAEIV